MSISRVFLLALGLAALSGPAWSEGGVADVSGGRIQGSVEGDLVVYKGVPFAAPPVGKLRWREPQPVNSWSGVRAATMFSRACTQPITPFMPPGQTPGEDCLYLNVWAPAKPPASPLPVMVWIHGGAFTTGGAAAPFFDGTHFAHRGVVLVSINYRLGALGFLVHPQLSKEAGNPSGNYGLEDQIAALRWVNENIARLGGDPKRVTIFGQSAGAGSVSMLAASRLAKGLFQRVIAQSGSAFEPPNPNGMVSSLDNAEREGIAALAEVGAADIAAARALPAEKFVGLKVMFRPVRDGRVLPHDQYALYEDNAQNDTPALIGYNSADTVMRPSSPAEFESRIRATYGAAADAILSAYPHASDDEKKHAALQVGRDSGFGWNTLTWARVQSAHSKNKIYTYFFDQVAPRDSIFFSPDGTVHTGEIPYVFGTLDAPPASYTAEDRKLSGQVQQYWVNFAKAGDPNGPGLPQWPAFSIESPRSMYFHGTPLATPMPNLKQVEAFDAYYKGLRAKQ